MLRLLVDITCIVILVIQCCCCCCCCSAYMLLADTFDTNAAALLLNRSHPRNTTSQSLQAASIRQRCLRSLEEISHSSISSMSSCLALPPTTIVASFNDANLPWTQQEVHVTQATCRHASRQHSTFKNTANRQVTQGHKQSAIYLTICIAHLKLHFEFACQEPISNFKLHWNALTLTFEFETDCWKMRLKSKSRLTLKLNLLANLISIQIKSQARTTHQNWTPDPLRAGGQAGRHGSAGPAVAHPGLTSSTLPPGVPGRAHAFEDGHPNGGLTPPRAHQQSHVLPPGPPSSELQILKVKEIVNLGVENIRDLKCWHVILPSGKSRICPNLMIFDPSQEVYLLISRISISELIAKRWRSTVPAPGPVRVSPMWQPRWA